MPGISRPVLSQFGINAEDQNDAQLVLFNLTGTDAGPNDTGASAVTASNYQIVAGNTWFTSVQAGAIAQLPQTNAAPGGFAGGLRGLVVQIVNTGANFLTLIPHPNDTGGTINLISSVVLQPNSQTPIYCQTPGNWFADGIGEGFAGAITTVASQGTIAPAGTTNATATQITQAMVNLSAAGASATGVALPKAAAGLQITVNFPTSGTSPLIVYPLNGSGDTINGAGSLSVTIPQATPAPIIFYCFVNGLWFTK